MVHLRKIVGFGLRSKSLNDSKLTQRISVGAQKMVRFAFDSTVEVVACIACCLFMLRGE